VCNSEILRLRKRIAQSQDWPRLRGTYTSISSTSLVDTCTTHLLLLQATDTWVWVGLRTRLKYTLGGSDKIRHGSWGRVQSSQPLDIATTLMSYGVTPLPSDCCNYGTQLICYSGFWYCSSLH